jgi:hypothetical protein
MAVDGLPSPQAWPIAAGFGGSAGHVLVDLVARHDRLLADLQPLAEGIRIATSVLAAIAGALAAAALEVAKYGFGWYLAQVSTYEVVYGALAALPIFLLWIYLCWIIILAGAAVSASIADPAGRRNRRQTRATD